MHEGFPLITLSVQNTPAFGSQAVKAPPPLPGFLDPSALQPFPFFQAIEKRIQRGYVEFQLSGRPRFDQFADFISVARPGFDNRKDDQFSGALLQLAIQYTGINSSHSHICYRQWMADATTSEPRVPFFQDAALSGAVHQFSDDDSGCGSEEIRSRKVVDYPHSMRRHNL